MMSIVHKPRSGEFFVNLLSLRALRQRAGLTQEALCCRTFRPDGSRPIWPSTLSKLENLRRPARLSTVERIAAALGVTRQALAFAPETPEERATWERAIADELAAVVMLADYEPELDEWEVGALVTDADAIAPQEQRACVLTA